MNDELQFVIGNFMLAGSIIIISLTYFIKESIRYELFYMFMGIGIIALIESILMIYWNKHLFFKKVTNKRLNKNE